MVQLANAAKTPVAAHLDHGNSVELCLKALRLGFSSVMFDGSALSYEENIDKTAFVCRVAHEFGAIVEKLRCVDPDKIEEALRETISARKANLLDLNLKAVAAGRAFIRG